MIDLTTILNNISQSLMSVASLIVDAGYVLGILFVMNGFFRLTQVNKQTGKGIALPVTFIFGGAALIYWPSTVEVLSNTIFGSNNILQYAKPPTVSIYGTVRVMIQTAGLLWFVRGTILLMHSAEPGKQHGSKGLFMVIASIFAVNFNYTVSSVSSMLSYVMTLTNKLP